MSVANVVCFQVEVSASGLSIVQGVLPSVVCLKRDRESSKKRRP